MERIDLLIDNLARQVPAKHNMSSKQAIVGQMKVSLARTRDITLRRFAKIGKTPKNQKACVAVRKAPLSLQFSKVTFQN